MFRKMSGKCYNDRPRNSMWRNEWRMGRLISDDDGTTVTDVQSQVSDFDPNLSDKWDVKERMRKLFESQEFTDVTFYPSNPPKNKRDLRISAHKAVLAIGSPLFKKMLFTDHKDNVTGLKMEVKISNLAFDAFTNIVRYLYTDEIYFEDDSLAQGIFDGAKQFGIQTLVERCKRHFESIELTNENVCSKLQLSISDKIDVLKERCIEYIQRNTHQVIKSSDFQQCNSVTIRTICKLQSLNLRSEVDLLEAVMNWVYEQPPQSRKMVLEPLLKCIRFLTFTVNQLGDIIKKYPNILTSEEGLSIMLFLYNPPKDPDFKKLPSWCNKSTTNRCFFNENPSNMKPGLGAACASTQLTGKVIFPLKPDNEKTSVTQLTSLLQMKCISGMHTIKAIRLGFGRPLSDKSVINSLCISVHSHSNNFRTQENVQVLNSESILVEFSKNIWMSRGQIIDIEVEANKIQNYRFLQFDEACQVPLNPHFQCCVSSRPMAVGKLYLIKEIEYGPQDRRKNDSNFARRGRRGRW